MSDMVNILTRTSNRPKSFKRCYESVQNQSYKNVRHLVSYDNDNDLKYLKDLNIDLFKVNRHHLLEKYKGSTFGKAAKFPYNLYLNMLMEQVTEGWIMILDDDDYFINNKSLGKIMSYKPKEDTIVMFQMEYPSGRVLPTKQGIRLQRPMRGGIGSCCFLFHSSNKHKSQFPPIKGGDFEFISKLYKQHKNSIWIQEPFVKLGNMGGMGKRKDID